MAGRNNAAIVVALHVVAQAMQNHPNYGGNDEFDIWGSSRGTTFLLSRKARFGTHMLAEEADDRWINTRQVLDVTAEVVTWNVFRRKFLRKYFSEDVRGKKNIEFLELKQGNLSVTEYAARFMELAKFYPHYNEATVEFSKCKNSRMIRRFPELVNSCRIYEGDSKVLSAHYKGLSERRGKLNLNRGKPYSAPADKVVDCKENMVTCYNYGEPGHINTRCPKPKQASTGGKVFALTGTHTSSDDRLGLVVSSMSEEMVIETPAKGSVTTTSVRFLTPSEEEEVGFLSTRELKELLEEEYHVFALFAMLSAKSQTVIDELQVVRDFLEVFPDDTSDVPLEREVEFSINLVPGTRPVSMAPHRMSTSELTELKKKLIRSTREEICETKCVTLGSSDVVSKEEIR
ncbi:uncharacterized protein LOC127079837 [Lathyrus oleraceus]|uniref:uncharacterized protein LOC127079837 n=1 Tax=Pisum sativum TaxID=3888 RepID=UPI0021CF9B04|nr:uncharacterized protein LOC127079837 [Pisum sativum]